MTAGKVLGILVLFLGLGASGQAGAEMPSSVGTVPTEKNEDFFEMSIEELMDVRIDTVFRCDAQQDHRQWLGDVVLLDCAKNSHNWGIYLQDEVLVNSPRHLAKLNLIKPLVPERLFAGLEVLYESRARTLSGDYADDFTLTNLTLTYVGVSRRLEVAASIYNLFDVDYAFPAFPDYVSDTVAQDGRTFRVGLTYRF